MRVLLVEDFEPLARSLAQGLREAGYAVDAAGDGEEALALGETNPYDAILLDLMMPGIGGFAVLKAIRAASPNANTPIIVVSIVGDAATISQCLSAGANAYHVKPVRRAELIATVKAQLAARRKQVTPIK